MTMAEENWFFETGNNGVEVVEVRGGLTSTMLSETEERGTGALIRRCGIGELAASE